MHRKSLIALAAAPLALMIAATTWIAIPTHSDLPIVPPLSVWQADQSDGASERYGMDLVPLRNGFRPQAYRSFCGPASIATVLRAYGAAADQRSIFPSVSWKLDAFYTGMTLDELHSLAQSAGLSAEIVRADKLTLHAFRERLKANLAHDGDFVLINYDRRILKQAGAGHISPIGAYDVTRDAFLILDEAAYRYPFTWVPTTLLYSAMHTRDGTQFRGLLFINAYHRSDPS